MSDPKVKEQLRNVDDHIAYLMDRMRTYRYKWLEEYYCAKNLELHMPDGIKVPDLDQIPEDIASPAFIPELLGWDGEGSEGGEGIIESAFVDCDMLMRFHFGLGVGHVYSHHRSMQAEVQEGNAVRASATRDGQYTTNDTIDEVEVEVVDEDGDEDADEDGDEEDSAHGELTLE
ncbi:hypothetical protein EV702DRAFT_1207104 [Suillus placidus]|uniref:Uncharacterized protein n=1 Tax=Suillus placidus TaxID=48579 RepID=A0A9P7CUN8_9AGAM|nr:hypothetical protein EV702DRAFT_1207104 [Suillus placidus]